MNKKNVPILIAIILSTIIAISSFYYYDLFAGEILFYVPSSIREILPNLIAIVSTIVFVFLKGRSRFIIPSILLLLRFLVEIPSYSFFDYGFDLIKILYFLLHLIITLIYLIFFVGKNFPSMLKKSIFQITVAIVVLFIFFSFLRYSIDIFTYWEYLDVSLGNVFLFLLINVLLIVFARIGLYIPLSMAYKADLSSEDTYREDKHKPQSSQVSIALNIFLTIFTFGIYFYFWVFNISSDLKKKNPSFQDPAITLLLILLIPFYSLYWFYKTGNDIHDLQSSQHVHRDNNSHLYLLIAFFGFSIVAIALVQRDLNQMNLSDEKHYETPKSSKKPQARPSSDPAKAIEALYDLFVKGAITEEEYNEKKKELLNQI